MTNNVAVDAACMDMSVLSLFIRGCETAVTNGAIVTRDDLGRMLDRAESALANLRLLSPEVECDN